jgi:hypothetical protein
MRIDAFLIGTKAASLPIGVEGVSGHASSFGRVKFGQPHLDALIRYMKARGQQRNIVVLITKSP